METDREQELRAYVAEAFGGLHLSKFSPGIPERRELLMLYLAAETLLTLKEIRVNIQTPVAEVLGILEALEQNTQPPAGVVEDARRYQRIKALLLSRNSITVQSLKDGEVVLRDGVYTLLAEGTTLDETIDKAEGF
jgi:hypothetical protein